MFLVIAFAAAAATAGGDEGRHPDPQTPAAPASAPLHPSSPTTVTIIPNAAVTDAFKKGGPLLETGEYKVQAARREAPGQVEIHARDTDVFYILEGSAVLVTGGDVKGRKTTAPNEARGTSISGGDSQTVNKGDVIVIPRGVPHWFKEVPQVPLLYFVVKSVAPEGAK
jgi:mannose-6-phosphate isomerase-like protein (cupin superfamily)